MPVKFQSDKIIITSISRLRDFMRIGGKTSYPFVNRGPGYIGCNVVLRVALSRNFLWRRTDIIFFFRLLEFDFWRNAYSNSCWESTRCCVQLVLPFSWFQSVLTGGSGRVARRLDTTVGGGRCLWDFDARVWNWAPTHEAIRGQWEFTLMPVHGDMF